MRIALATLAVVTTATLAPLEPAHAAGYVAVSVQTPQFGLQIGAPAPIVAPLTGFAPPVYVAPPAYLAPPVFVAPPAPVVYAPPRVVVAAPVVYPVVRPVWVDAPIRHRKHGHGAPYRAIVPMSGYAYGRY